jgi:AraC-like DNA-binding protein
VTAYIREKRMQHARHLLRTTNLQIGTVALHCGIPDIHYFAKLFKKETGMTPGQYREHGS